MIQVPAHYSCDEDGCEIVELGVAVMTPLSIGQQARGMAWTPQLPVGWQCVAASQLITNVNPQGDGQPQPVTMRCRACVLAQGNHRGVGVNGASRNNSAPGPGGGTS